MKGEKERAERKKGGEEKKKAMVALLVFILVTLVTLYWSAKKLLDLLGGNVFKNSARFICISVV